MKSFMLSEPATRATRATSTRGKIVNLEPSIQAAFVDFSVGRNGFLHVSDVEPQYFDRPQGMHDEPGPDPRSATASAILVVAAAATIADALPDRNSSIRRLEVYQLLRLGWKSDPVTGDAIATRSRP